MDNVTLPGAVRARGSRPKVLRDVAKVLATGRLPARKLTDRLPTFAILRGRLINASRAVKPISRSQGNARGADSGPF